MTRELSPYIVFAFATTHNALEAEDVLKAGGFDVVPIPTPSGAPGRCGIAMRLPPSQADPAAAALKAAGVTPVSQINIEDY